ncbi:MAG: hypothetical protein C0490_08270 [Marivirga sp.]|nr:hypothetical protein [Marivirga sp.]
MDYIPFLWDIICRKKISYLIVTLSKVPLMRFLAICFFASFIVHAAWGQDKFLLITSGGGVTGTANVYKISADGTVKKGKGLGEIAYNEESKLKKCTTKKFFKRTKSLMNAYPDFNHPGNMYTSISLTEPDSEKKITWGATEHEVPEDAKKLHQKIITKLSRLTFTSDSRK